MRYTQVMTISGKGPAPEQFTTMLRGACVDASGRLYAVGDRAVKVFDAAGKLVRQWPLLRPAYCAAVQADSPSRATGSLSASADIGRQAASGTASASSNDATTATVWVGESGQIERFDTHGNSREPFRDGDRLGTVTAIGFHGDNILVADATARCIRRYDAKGNWLNDIGHKNNTQGFVIPNGCLDFRIDAAGVIHAANPAKHRVERYTLTGELLGQFGKFGMTRPEDFGGCCNPTNIALLTDGAMAVTEKAPPRLKVYDGHGTVVAMVGPEAFDAQCKNMGLTVDSQGRIYVIDTERLCILVFAPEGIPTTAPGSQPSALSSTLRLGLEENQALKSAGGGR